MTVTGSALNVETGEHEQRIMVARDLRRDAKNRRQVLFDLDGLPADGATVVLPDGIIRDARGKSAGPLTVQLRTPFSPLAATLAGIAWEPTDHSLFSHDGIIRPAGTKDREQVRRELEARLRIRPGMTDGQIAAVLARFNEDGLVRKAPDHRVHAGLLLLTGTSAEFAIEYIVSDSNRRRAPFAPIEVHPIAELGVFAGVVYDPVRRLVHMVVDTAMAADSLEMIAVMLTHETLHSSLGEGSASEEALAMAVQTRVYQEFLLGDPSLAEAPTAATRQQVLLTLALRNSGRFSYPRAGILPRPGIEDALRAMAETPITSFKDFVFHPRFYGDLRKAGDTGTEVLEAYFQRIAGEQRQSLLFDAQTLKLFDAAMDNGFSDDQILAIIRALKLRPVPVQSSTPTK